MTMHTCFMWLPRTGTPTRVTEIETPESQPRHFEVAGDVDILPVHEVTPPLATGSSLTVSAVREDPDNGCVLVKIESDDPGYCGRLTTDFADLAHVDLPDQATVPSKAARGRLRGVVDGARTRFNADRAGQPDGRGRPIATRPQLVEFERPGP